MPEPTALAVMAPALLTAAVVLPRIAVAFPVPPCTVAVIEPALALVTLAEVELAVTPVAAPDPLVALMVPVLEVTVAVVAP
jgi:hypothetical protein